MKSSLFLLLRVAVLLVPVLARAHPGHDGGHDLEWDTSHFAAHPMATLLCVGALAAGIWAAARLVRPRRAKGEIVPSQVRTPR